MYKIILGIAAVMVALNCSANDTTKTNKTPEQVANRKADHLKSELGLTDVQRSQVYASVLEKINKTRDLKQKYKDSLNHKGMRIEMKLVKDAHERQMSSILTPEQKVKYDALKQKDKGLSKEKHKGNQTPDSDADGDD